MRIQKFGAARMLPLVLFASLAQGAVVTFNPGTDCENTSEVGGVIGVKCYGDFFGAGAISQQFSGTGTGTFTTDTIDFTHDFTVHEVGVVIGGQSYYTAEITVRINGSIANSTKFSGLFGEQQTGAFPVIVPNGQDLETWSIKIALSADKTKLHLEIPNNSVDLRGQAPNTVVPEPASVALAGGGLLLVGMAARRRRRQ